MANQNVDCSSRYFMPVSQTYPVIFHCPCAHISDIVNVFVPTDREKMYLSRMHKFTHVILPWKLIKHCCHYFSNAPRIWTSLMCYKMIIF